MFSRHRHGVRSRRAGSMLIEMSCALFVITVGIFGVLQLYSLGMSKTRTVKEYAVATRALNNEIETLRALPFDALEEGRGLPFRSVCPELEGLRNATPTVAIIDKSAETLGMKRVRVRLRWTGEHGRTIDKGLTTLIARKR